MWPYTGRRNIQTSHSGNLELTGNNPNTTTRRIESNLDNEYFNKISMTLSIGLTSYPAHKIAGDGRVLTQYGNNTTDVTGQYCHDGDPRLSSRRRAATTPSKQLHSRNVSQLKVVLDMPDKLRRTSLTQVAGVIIRNEVVPTVKQLENDEFLNDQLKKSTDKFMLHKLPPLLYHRKSLEKSKKMENFARLRMIHAHNENIRRSSKHQLHVSDDDLYGDIPLPSISGRPSTEPSDMDRRSSYGHDNNQRRTSSVKHYSANQKDTAQHINTGTHQDGATYNRVYSSPLGKRKESVTRTTSSISEQFRKVVREQMEIAQTKSRENPNNATGLSVAGNAGNEVLTGPGDPGRSSTMGYKLRHEYGKNLERNWFKSFLKKSSNSKKKQQEAMSKPYDLRLDIFYSPEPQSDAEMDALDDETFVEDDASIQCGGFSTATAEARSKHGSQRRSLRLSTSVLTGADALQERDEHTDEDTSGSDIEIVLKDDQLIQRKTKHKLRKKRKRQMERYKAFMPAEMEVVKEHQEPSNELPLTDQEIRALRLNLRNKERLSKLKGKRKFLQAANAVYIAVQFKNILNKIRKRKRKLIKDRQQRIASMNAKRLTWKNKGNESDEDIDSQSIVETPKPTLRDQFMQEFGNKLLLDISNLKIDSKTSIDGESNDADCENDSSSGESDTSEGTGHEPKVNKKVAPFIPKLSNFEKEIKKISMRDLQIAFPMRARPHRLIKRRKSLPLGERPLEFCLEVPEKTKRRKDKNDKKVSSTYARPPIRRTNSPVHPKCSCFRHVQQEKLQSAMHKIKCLHSLEVKKPKMKIIRIPTSGLYKTYSLEDLRQKRPIELRDLLHDIDIPAKEIKLQILARKFMRQRRKRQQIKLAPYEIPERIDQEQELESDLESETSGSDDSDPSDYGFEYGSPFVGSGVMWNQNSKKNKQITWTEADVEREVKKITKIFHEMKECTYLRLDTFNEAIMKRLNEKKNLIEGERS